MGFIKKSLKMCQIASDIEDHEDNNQNRRGPLTYIQLAVICAKRTSETVLTIVDNSNLSWKFARVPFSSKILMQKVEIF